MGGALRIGTSGYQYDHWRGSFYPEELPKRRWLERYVREFDTLEINSTFYRLPSREVFASWRREAPAGFVFAVKMSRFATHMKHLSDGAETIGRLMERASALGPTLGPILVQLPPRWNADPARLDAFLAAFAERAERPRVAVEVRHSSWLSRDVYSVLERRGAALVLHDRLPEHPRVLTADWAYLRFHGASPHAYEGAYPDRPLETKRAGSPPSSRPASTSTPTSTTTSAVTPCATRDASAPSSRALGSGQRNRGAAQHRRASDQTPEPCRSSRRPRRPGGPPERSDGEGRQGPIASRWDRDWRRGAPEGAVSGGGAPSDSLRWGEGLL